MISIRRSELSLDAALARRASLDSAAAAGGLPREQQA